MSAAAETPLKAWTDYSPGEQARMLKDLAWYLDTRLASERMDRSERYWVDLLAGYAPAAANQIDPTAPALHRPALDWRGLAPEQQARLLREMAAWAEREGAFRQDDYPGRPTFPTLARAARAVWERLRGRGPER